MAQRQRAHLLGQIMRMTANDRPERAAASAKLGRAGRTVTGVAGALLFEQLLAGTPDFRTSLGLAGARLTLGELPVYAALNQVLARLEPEDPVR
jgi:hypothetical protein